MSDLDIKKILSRFKEKRKELKLSQSAVGKHLGLSPAAYNKIEEGTTALKLQVLYDIARFLELDVAELLGFRAKEDEDKEALIAVNEMQARDFFTDLKKDQKDIKKEILEMRKMLEEQKNRK